MLVFFLLILVKNLFFFVNKFLTVSNINNLNLTVKIYYDKMRREKYPIYLENTPKGIDELKGESHKKIADAICNIINTQTKKIKRQVIGLEGDWGSGKSNIIKSIEENIEKETKLEDKKYFHLIFDAWGHQEDLSRRSILEEIIDYLSLKKYNSFKNDDWEKKQKELTGKTIISEKTYSPEIKLFWIFFISSLAFLKFSDEYFKYDILPIDCYNIKNKLNLTVNVPIILFLVGICFLIKEWISLKKVNNKRKFKKNNFQLFSELVYFIKGEDIQTKTTDFVIEKEPSNKDFRNFLDFINEKLKTEEKTLILTIDNIDRLTKEKIKSLWSTINIFFADKGDDKYFDNIWLIIPYDEDKIIDAFIEENKGKEIGLGLIEKTFSVKFRVPPPIPSNWEKLFEEKLELAFGTEIIPNEEIEVIKRIFDGFITDIITPRQIINFVNDLVTSYSINTDIKFRYLSLFVMAKNEIIDYPIQNILNNKYWQNKNLEMFFTGDIELEKNIAAITFGVPLEMAEEIVYSNEIQSIINFGKQNELEKFTHNKFAFQNNFYREFNNIDFRNMIFNSAEKIPLLLKKIKELSLIDEYHLENTYWKNLKRKAIAFEKYKDTNFELNELHKELFEHNFEYGKEYLEQTIEKMQNRINGEVSVKEYIDKLKTINNFLNEKTKITISDLNFNTSTSRSVEASSYIYLVSIFPEDFQEIKSLKCSEKTISDYYFNKDDNELDIEKLFDDIDELKIIKKELKYNFSTLIKQIKEEINKIKSQNLENLDKYIESLKILSEEKPLSGINIPNNIIYNNIANYEDNESVYISLICIAFTNIDDLIDYTSIKNIYNSNEKELIKKVCSEIEYYTDYNDILKKVNNIDYELPLIKEITIELTKNSYGTSRLSIEWVIKNYSSILKKVFDNDNSLSISFYKRISAWIKYIKDYLNKSQETFKSIDLSIIDYALKIDNELSKFLISKSNEYLNSLGLTEIQDIIDNKNTIENNLFKKLNQKNKVSESFIKNKLQPKLIKYLEDYIEGKVTPLETNFNNLKNLFSGIENSKQKENYKKFITKINKQEKFEFPKVRFFIEGIIKHNLLAKTSNIYLEYFINCNLFDFFFFNRNMYKEIIDIVAKSNDSTLKSLIWEKVKRKHDANPIKKYAKEKGLKVK